MNVLNQPSSNVSSQNQSSSSGLINLDGNARSNSVNRYHQGDENSRGYNQTPLRAQVPSSGSNLEIYSSMPNLKSNRDASFDSLMKNQYQIQNKNQNNQGFNSLNYGHNPILNPMPNNIQNQYILKNYENANRNYFSQVGNNVF